MTKQTKIIIAIILLIISIFTFQFLTKPKIDTNSYVTLVSGEASLNNNPLVIKQKKILKENDLLKTGSDLGTLAIIEWGEGSITRVGPNTVLRIDKAKVSQDLTKIEILFKLLGNSGKTWSDVVSFIGEDSYFKQGFADTEAAVRGTTFEVNLDKDYVYVEKHEVLLKNTKNGKNYVIPEKKPFSIKLFDFVALEKFIISLRDKTWQELNKQLDKEVLKKLKKNIKQALDNVKQLGDLDNIDFDKLSLSEKEELYKKLLSSYQELKPSTISPGDPELYKYKLQYQKILTKLAPKEDKKKLLITTFYDLKDAVDLKNFDDFKNIMEIIGENKQYIDIRELSKIIDISGFSDSLKRSIINFIEDTKQGNYSNLLGDSFKSFENLNIQKMTDQIKDNLPGLDEVKSIGENLGNSLNGLTKNLINN